MSQISIPDALKMASGHRQAGRLAEAEAICRNLLQQAPDQPDVLHMLGLMVSQRDFPQAQRLIQRAIQLRPNSAELHNSFGCIFSEHGDVKNGTAAFRHALNLKPGYLEARLNLSQAMSRSGNLEEARAVLKEGLRFKPDWDQGRAAILRILRLQKKSDEAARFAKASLEHCAELHEAFETLAFYHFERDEYEQAAHWFRRLSAVMPRMGRPQMYLSIAQRRAGQLDEAVASARRAVDRSPESNETHLTLGNALRAVGQYEEAERSFRRAIQLSPDYADGFANLGAVLRDQVRLDESHDAFRKAVALQPENANAHWNLALALLFNGQFELGWVEYEWRYQRPNFTKGNRKNPGPQWYGDDPVGKTIVVGVEQGFGDAIQMARYIPLLAQRGARVLLQAHPETIRLLKSVDGLTQISSIVGQLPSADVHVPIMSLPLAFETTRESIPSNVPYLHADMGDVARWAEKLSSYGAGRRIGIVWAGQPSHDDDRFRSMQQADLAPLVDVPGSIFFSLQKGGSTKGSSSTPAGLKLIDLGPELTDFAEIAAVIANLDLVISVDTAVVHLAGALGKTCWVLLAEVCDWRWLRDREDSPWYPTHRLIRRQKGQSWEQVMRRVAGELRA